jgi:hypothetical protein
MPPPQRTWLKPMKMKCHSVLPFRIPVLTRLRGGRMTHVVRFLRWVLIKSGVDRTIDYGAAPGPRSKQIIARRVTRTGDVK